MGMAKGYKTNINIKNERVGVARRQEILDGIADKGTYLPRGVLIEDMDQSFVDFVDTDDRLSVSIDDKKVPVIFLTIQRWTEFTKTWAFTDEYKNIEMPFITIVRRPDIQAGNNQAGLWNIPGNQTYTYMKVPTWDGVRRGIDLYKVPQPTSVDILYEVRFFTNRMKDLNKFHSKIQRAFQSRQCYINVNGHPMPLFLETSGDESNIDGFEKRRFYVQMFEVKLEGYILDEEDFKVIPTFNRTVTTLELKSEISYENVVIEPTKIGNEIAYKFLWSPNSTDTFTFNALYTGSLTELLNIENITRIIIKVNGFGVFDGTVLTTPLNIQANDSIMIKIYKNNLATGKFTLIGNII